MKRKMRASARTALLYVVLLGWTACGADSCSCDGFVAKDFPPAKVNRTIPTSGEIRVTSSGVQFLQDNLPALVGALVPGGLSFCVPPTSQSGLNVCDDGSTCSSGELGCDMTLTIDDASIVPQPPNTLDISITIGGLDESLPIEVLGADCYIDLRSAANANLPAQLEAAIPISFTVDTASPFNDVRIELADPELVTDDLDFDIRPDNILDFLVCEGIDLVAGLDLVRDLALGLLTDEFVPIIQEQIDEQLCKTCDAGCPAGTSCDGSNICRYGDGTCAQNPLGITGELQIGTVLADYTERPQASMDMTVRAADHAVVDTGLTIGLRSGYDPIDTGVCVPVDPTVRDFAATPLSPTVTGNATPLGQPFHFGLGYHKKAIEHMLWSVWGSGATCLNVGTANIDLLTTGALGALLPSIRQLAYGKSSEAFIKIVPQKPPQVILGANDVTPNGTTYTVNDPLMTIDWKDFDVHIYAFAQDRFTRVVTIRMDLLLPIAIVPDGMGSIVPIIGDLETAFVNQRVINGELVAEDPARILDLLPTLIGFALPSIAGSIAEPIEVPEFSGFQILIGEDGITSVDNNTSIAIFANLAIAATPIVAGTETTIVGTQLDLSRRTPSGLVRPVAYVDLLPLSPTLRQDHSPDVEYSYRVNGGTWSLFERTTQLAIDDPMLIVPGAHEIQVRARQVGQDYTVDRTPAQTTVFVDWEAPLVEIERDDAIVTLETSDISDPDHLEMRYKIIDGQTPGRWTDWEPVAPLDLQRIDAPDRFRLVVEVRDRAGNVGEDTQTVTWRMPLEREGGAPTPATHDGPHEGCSSTGDSAPTSALWLLLAAAVLYLRPRRRRVRLPVLGLAAIICLGACKCGKDTGQETLCDPACPVGQQCLAGACVTGTQCTVDDDCADNERCVTGECVNSPTCESLCQCADDELAVCNDDGETCGCVPYCDKGCEENEYCCYESNSCEALPDPCADTMCEIGFGPVVTTSPAGDSPSCDVTAGACECQELPPLPLGWHGHYAAVDRNAGVTGVAVYNSTYEDLMVGVVDASFSVTWDFVDGVPATGDVEGSLNGPRGGISDKGDDVGRWTALAIDDAGTFHVFYRDADRGVLKYARGTVGGTWDISDLATDGDVGYWSDAVHVNGRIHLVYTAKTTQQGASWMTELRHLAFDATGAPSDPTATQLVVASGTAAHPCGADCADRNQGCVAAIGQCVAPTTDCAAACEDGTQCYQGSCQIVYEEPPIGYLRAAAANTQLTPAPNGGLLVAFYDRISNSALWARYDGTAWTAPTLLGTGTGPWIGGIVDASDNVHLAYMERVGEVPQLTYADVTAGTTEMVQDGIRDTADWWLVSDIGEDVEVRVAGGTITLLYQDAAAHTLRMATRPSGGGAWTVSDVASPGNPYTGAHGFYATMLKASDSPFSAELVINNQLDPTEAAPAFDE